MELNTQLCQQVLLASANLQLATFLSVTELQSFRSILNCNSTLERNSFLVHLVDRQMLSNSVGNVIPVLR